jgi:predicted alpha/beta superfamily hydrolase
MIGISTTRRCMYTEDYEEWRWGQILTRRADYNPDDQPPVEDEEDAQTQE